MDISVEEIEASVFQVTVKEGDSESRHRVTVPDDLYQRLTGGKISQAECVEAAFRFLLDREPKESIMSQFDLPVIGHYFPEFERKFKNYL
jgi:hypothetical protein